jgi:hypothetical protein
MVDLNLQPDALAGAKHLGCIRRYGTPLYRLFFQQIGNPLTERRQQPRRITGENKASRYAGDLHGGWDPMEGTYHLAVVGFESVVKRTMSNPEPAGDEYLDKN